MSQLLLFSRSKSLAAFCDFYRDNRPAYEMFVETAKELRKRGFHSYSADHLAHTVRVNCDLNRNGELFALNNNHIVFMSRLAMMREPQLSGFFPTRQADVDEAELVRLCDEIDRGRCE